MRGLSFLNMSTIKFNSSLSTSKLVKLFRSTSYPIPEKELISRENYNPKLDRIEIGR